MPVDELEGCCRSNWKAAKRIDKNHLSKLVAGLESITPTMLDVDEISYQKGRKYLTVVRDLTPREVIWAGISRKKEALSKFFKELGKKKCRRIKFVVLDMWDPYIASVKENTKAEIVFNKFHIAKEITEALDKIHRQEFAKADPELKKKFKKKRFVILKRGKRLDKRNQETLQDLMKGNEKLYQAYLLKEQVLDSPDEERPSSPTFTR